MPVKKPHFQGFFAGISFRRMLCFLGSDSFYRSFLCERSEAKLDASEGCRWYFSCWIYTDLQNRQEAARSPLCGLFSVPAEVKESRRLLRRKRNHDCYAARLWRSQTMPMPCRGAGQHARSGIGRGGMRSHSQGLGAAFELFSEDGAFLETLLRRRPDPQSSR